MSMARLSQMRPWFFDPSLKIDSDARTAPSNQVTLFGGFAREPGERPVIFPVACAPQAWSAAEVFLILQGCLGLSINALEGKIKFVRPSLPPFLSKARLSDLTVGTGTVELLVVCHERNVSVKVLHNEEDFEVVILPSTWQDS